MGGAAENLERRVREMKEIWDFKLNSRSRAAAPLTRAAARNPGFLFVYARAPRRELAARGGGVQAQRLAAARRLRR